LRIEGFIWLEEIVEKIARKHNVQVHEAEQVFQNLPKFRFRREKLPGRRRRLLGVGVGQMLEDTLSYSSFTNSTVVLCR